MTKADFGGWVILRTQGRHTLKLTQTLGEDGFEVWTPTETRLVRVPRMNAKREVKLPIMPSYVFAKAHQLIDLIQLADMPLKPRRGPKCHDPAHEDFSVMRCFGGIPMVSEVQLQALREMERKLTPKKKILAERAFAPGVEVRVSGGSFGGMTGSVERSDKGQTVVCFSGKYLVKIATCLLNEKGLEYEQMGDDSPEAEAA